MESSIPPLTCHQAWTAALVMWVYNFAVPRLSSWFCTDDVVSQTEMRQVGIEFDTIFDDDLNSDTAVLSDEPLYPAFYGMPMGWSWSLYMANEIINHQCLEGLRQGSDTLIRDKRPPPLIQSGKVAVGVYVDNVITVGGGDTAAGAMRRISQHFSGFGIPFEIDIPPSGHCRECLGMEFHLQDTVTVKSSNRRAWRVWLVIRAVLRRKRVHGKFMQILLGHINHHFSLMRPAMACLSASYRFALDHNHHRHPLWHSVRRELKTAMGLIFLVEKDMSSQKSSQVHIGDSSVMDLL